MKNKNPFRINRFKEDFESLIKGGSFWYKIKRLPKTIIHVAKNGYSRFKYGYDDNDWYEYFTRSLERDRALFYEFISKGDSNLPIIISGEKIGDMTEEQTRMFFEELISIADKILEYDSTFVGDVKENWKKEIEYTNQYFDIMKNYFLHLWD